MRNQIQQEISCRVKTWMGSRLRDRYDLLDHVIDMFMFECGLSNNKFEKIMQENIIDHVYVDFRNGRVRRLP